MLALRSLATESEMAALTLARVLVAQGSAGKSVAGTWLNHYSAVKHMSRTSPSNLSEFDYVGIDGQLLRRIVGSGPRTSADLVIPRILEIVPNMRIAIIGAQRSALLAAARTLAAINGARVVALMDGYDGLLRGPRLIAWCEDAGADLVVVGLGPGLQEDVSLEIRSAEVVPLVLTCGGFIDQVGKRQYYPRWAYPLGLTWLVRLAREPRRLWKRYSLDAVTAIRGRAELREGVDRLPGFQALKAAVGSSRAGRCI